MAETDNAETQDLTFVCSKCGECCRHIEAFTEVWPYQRGGICDFLEGDICAVYDKRPDFCDYKRAYNYFKDYLPVAEYKELVIFFCEKFKNLKNGVV
jgi:Fe-S-cluster containining protein